MKKILELITRVIELSHYSHIFPDGNTRIFGFILLNKLLIENHMCPTMVCSGDDICLPIAKKFGLCNT